MSFGKFQTQEVISTQRGWVRLLSTLVSLLAFSPVRRVGAGSLPGSAQLKVRLVQLACLVQPRYLYRLKHIRMLSATLKI